MAIGKFSIMSLLNCWSGPGATFASQCSANVQDPPDLPLIVILFIGNEDRYYLRVRVPFCLSNLDQDDGTCCLAWLVCSLIMLRFCSCK